MNCEKLHVTDEAFRNLVRNYEELERENKALRDEVEQLKHAGVEEREEVRDLTYEEAARVADAQAANARGRTENAVAWAAVEIAARKIAEAIRSLKSDSPTAFVIVTRKEWEALKKRGGKP